jgi:hypothetical protein
VLFLRSCCCPHVSFLHLVPALCLIYMLLVCCALISFVCCRCHLSVSSLVRSLHGAGFGYRLCGDCLEIGWRTSRGVGLLFLLWSSILAPQPPHSLSSFHRHSRLFSPRLVLVSSSRYFVSSSQRRPLALRCVSRVRHLYLSRPAFLVSSIFCLVMRIDLPI